MATITATPNPATGATRLTITSPRIVEEITRLDANGLAPVRVRPGVLPYLPDTVTGRTNLIIDPSFVRGQEGLASTNAAGEWQATGGLYGPEHARLKAIAAGLMRGRLITTAAAPGQQYTASVYVRTAAARDCRLQFDFNTAAGVYQTAVLAPQTIVPAGEWTRLSLTVTVPAGNIGQIIVFARMESAAIGNTLDLDGAMLEQTGTLGAYFDGSTPDDDLAMYGWDGSANNSTSSSTVDAGALIIDDYEAAHGEATYTVREQFTLAPTEPARTTATTTLDGPWIMVPVSPDYSRRVETINEYSQARASLSTELQPLDRSDVIVIMRPLGARRGRLGVVCGSYADAAALEDTCNRGEIVMLRQPEHAGMDMYFYVQQANLTPLTKDGGRTRWGVDLAYVSVTRPEGDQNGAIGWDFADVAAAYADFEAIADAFLDFEALEMRDTA